MTNPDWNRYELILALDLYFSLGYGQMDSKNSEVKVLSHVLTLMNKQNGFERNENSVALKLNNFKRIDPQFTGKGMKGGGKLEKVVWNEFSINKSRLQKVALGIKTGIIKNAVSTRKQAFRSWLEKTGKPDGTNYEERTIQVYTNQVDRGILNEFAIEVSEPPGLYGITDIAQLEEIGKKLSEKSDSKRRRDLRSAFHKFLKFAIEEQEWNGSESLLDEVESLTEGGKKVYISQRAERDIRLKNKAIAIHGTTCKACGFNFGKTYGEWGTSFIEVHHLIPLGGKDSKERETNPEKDMVVLCSNCHRMIHRKKNIVLTLDELKQKLIYLHLK
ncbi:MAG: HNH endonuclease [Bacteroidota bacterium]